MYETAVGVSNLTRGAITRDGMHVTGSQDFFFMESAFP